MSYSNQSTFIKAIFILQTTYLFGQSPSVLLGKWKGEDKPNNHTEFFQEKDGLYYGKLIFEGVEKKNIGKILFKKMTYNTAKKEFKGWMSPPEGDMEIDASLTFISPDKLKIVVRKFLMSKTIYLIRIKQN